MQGAAVWGAALRMWGKPQGSGSAPPPKLGGTWPLQGLELGKCKECREEGMRRGPFHMRRATAAASSHPNGNRAEATAALSFVLKPGVGPPRLPLALALLIPPAFRDTQPHRLQSLQHLPAPSPSIPPIYQTPPECLSRTVSLGPNEPVLVRLA